MGSANHLAKNHLTQLSFVSAQLIQEIRNTLENERILNDSELRDTIIHHIHSHKIAKTWTTSNQFKLLKRIFYSLRGLDVLQSYIEDEEVTEIMINQFDEIFIEKHGNMQKVNEQFDSEERLNEFIQSILGRMNKAGNETSPIIDARMIDGSRIHVVLPPIALKGPSVTIRKFSKDGISLSELVSKATMPIELAAYLRWAVEHKKNIFISGGTGTGKTTLLNALAACIPCDERIITIEDTAELNIKNIPNQVRLESRIVFHHEKSNISIRDLIKAALRMRPNRIIVGEVRGGEVIDMLTAMNTGHEGSMSTGHSNSPLDLISRLETMAMIGSLLPIDLIRKQIGSAIQIIIHLERLPTGKRIVKEVCELMQDAQSGFTFHTVYINSNEHEKS